MRRIDRSDASISWITSPKIAVQGRQKLGRTIRKSRERPQTRDDIADIVAFARSKPKSTPNLLRISFFPEEPLFHTVLTGVALLLLSLFWWQIKTFPNMELAKQPGFWPGVSLAGMVLFGFGSCWRSFQRSRVRGSSIRAKELKFWAQSLEYPLWFLGYVWLVPIIGYLLATILIACSLVWRTGYRSIRQLIYAAGVGTAIVLIFKSLLEVKIPGGAIYEFLPNALRTFAIVNF